MIEKKLPLTTVPIEINKIRNGNENPDFNFGSNFKNDHKTASVFLIILKKFHFVVRKLTRNKSENNYVSTYLIFG